MPQDINQFHKGRDGRVEVKIPVEIFGHFLDRQVGLLVHCPADGEIVEGNRRRRTGQFVRPAVDQPIDPIQEPEGPLHPFVGPFQVLLRGCGKEGKETGRIRAISL